MIKIFLIFFIGIIGREVLCSSRNFIESAVEPTPICIMIGIRIINREAIHVTRTFYDPSFIVSLLIPNSISSCVKD